MIHSKLVTAGDKVWKHFKSRVD